MAVVGNGDTEMDLHALAVFLKLCSPVSANLKNGTVISSGCDTDKVKDGDVVVGNNLLCEQTFFVT